MNFDACKSAKTKTPCNQANKCSLDIIMRAVRSHPHFTLAINKLNSPNCVSVLGML